ncbi:hypothetical protein [Dyella sp.]|uniref:hypothetical protein n=1 Tax=Dyella sp. TaxID=1869338 RepID=UPI002ED0E27E
MNIRGHHASFFLGCLIIMGVVLTAPASRAAEVDFSVDSLHASGAEPHLRNLLGSHYQAFADNMTSLAYAVRLKDGGLFLDGWRDDQQKHAAAFVHYDDGRTIAAYYNQEEGKIVYAGEGTIHPAMRVWIHRFAPPLYVLPSSSEPLSPHEHNESTGSLTPEDKIELKKVAMSIWPGEVSKNWEMNEAAGDILGTVTKHIMDCSSAFSLVPKPVGWVPGWLYVAKTSAAIVAYVAGVSKNRVYSICVTTAASKWRTDIELAAIGI